MLFAVSSRFCSPCPAYNALTVISSFLLVFRSSFAMGCDIFGVMLLMAWTKQPSTAWTLWGCKEFLMIFVVAWAEQPPANKTFRLQSFLQYRSLPCHVTIPHQSSESLTVKKRILLLLVRFSSEREAWGRIVITSSIRNQLYKV
jgi:hypothetical protein